MTEFLVPPRAVYATEARVIWPFTPVHVHRHSVFATRDAWLIACIQGSP